MKRRKFLASLAAPAILHSYEALACNCSFPPSPNVAVGYNTLTFGPAIQPLGTALRPFTFFGTVPGNPTQNPDGSITVTTPSTGFGADLCTASLVNGASTWQNFSGVAFGGGCYAEAVMSQTGGNVNPGMSFWCNDIESMNGGSVGDLTGRQWPGQPTGFGNWIEVDFAEFDASGNSYGCGDHNWYGTTSSVNDVNTGSYPGWVSPVTPGTNIDWAGPHAYGWLWVPATSTTQGYQKFYFDGVQVGQTLLWNKWSSSQVPPPVQGSTAYNVLDTRHIAIIFGCGSAARPLTVHSLSVWQATDANNIRG